MIELFFSKVADLQTLQSLWHRYFPVNIAKFWRTPILKNICERLLLKLSLYTVRILQKDHWHSKNHWKYSLLCTESKCCKSLPNKPRIIKFKIWRKYRKHGITISSYKFDRWDSLALWQIKNHVLTLDSLWIVNV